MIVGYHSGRESANPTRRNSKFWYASNGRLKGVPASEAGRRMYSGLEWEVAMFPSCEVAEACSDYVDSVLGQYAVCMHDGSLRNGFEIVFDPMTERAFALIRPLIEQVAAEIERRGGKAHDTTCCGLHVHLSRCAFGNDEHAQMLAFGKMLELTERFQSAVSAIARRDITTCQWCLPTGYGHALTDGSRAIVRKAKRIQDSQGLGFHDGRRYRVWNFQNRPTVECRAFKGTLNVGTMFATIAFVNGIARYCMQHTTPDVHALQNFNDLIAWIGSDDLTTYWANVQSRRGSYRMYAAAA